MQTYILWFERIVLSKKTLVAAIACAVIAGFLALSKSPRIADSTWQTFGEDEKASQTSNLSMITLPTDFNRYHHFVGTFRKKIFVNGGEINRSASLYIPFGKGPYGDKSGIEIEFNNDKDHTIARFRFVENVGAKFVIGKYSSWQTTDFGSPHGFDRSGDDLDQLTFYSREKFYRTKWLKDVGGRWKQVWDLLHTTPIIGLNRSEVLNLLGPESPPQQRLNGIGYYRLADRTDHLSAPLKFLELKYDNDRVVAFKSLQLREIERSGDL
jgi:hypothetical protein